MSGANKKPWKGRALLLAVAPWAAAIALGVAAEALGILCSHPWGVAAYAVALGLLILLPIAGKVGATLYARGKNGLNVEEMNRLLDTEKAAIESDVAVAWKKLRRNCILARFCWAGYAILSLVVCFFSGATGRAGECVLGVVLGIYNLSAYFQQLLFPGMGQELPACVPQEQYPALYALVREAAGDMWKDTPIRIWLDVDLPDGECCAAAGMTDGVIDLHLGILLLNILTEGELRQVLLHEFSHLNQLDCHQAIFFNKTMKLLDVSGSSVLGVLPGWACEWVGARLAYQGQLFFLVSSREKERRADSQAAQLGDPELQAAALAKLSCHDLWTFEEEPYYVPFPTPEPPQHSCSSRVEAFRQALPKRGADWKTILENEIPARVASHPTFRQRWEALGCCDYTLTVPEEDSPLRRECRELLEEVDKSISELPAENYAKQWQEHYEKPLALVTEWEKTMELLPPEEMRPVMLAYLDLGQPGKMEALCDRLLEGSESPFSAAFANFWKGKLLLYRYDKAGLAYIYNAIEANTNYIQPGLDAIGTYCTRMGLAQELAEYRSRAPQLLQQVRDRQTGGLTRSKLAPETLPEGWLEKIRTVAVEAARGHLEKLYLVKELAGEDYRPSAFVLRFPENCEDEIIQDTYDRVFALLDDWPVDWEFTLYVFEPPMEKPLSRVPGSCVYEKEGQP